MKPSFAFVVVVAAGAALMHPVVSFGCKQDEVKGWIAACDTITGGSQAKCNDRKCHAALHRLVEDETIQCYVASGLGPATDMTRFKALDEFCHGEGPDPATSASSTPTSTSTSAPSATRIAVETAPSVAPTSVPLVNVTTGWPKPSASSSVPPASPSSSASPVLPSTPATKC